MANEIGVRMERSLHAALKARYEPDSTKQEVPYMGYIADIRNAAGITEIQTSGFGKLRGKIDAFTKTDEVTIVYPAIRQRYLHTVDSECGDIPIKSRKSPKRGSWFDLFDELIYLKPQLWIPRLHFRVVLLDTDDYRIPDGLNRFYRPKMLRIDRRIREIIGERELLCPHDFLTFLPETLPERFDFHMLAAMAKIPEKQAQRTLSVLRYCGLLILDGKLGRGYAYRIAKDAAQHRL